MGVYIEGLEMPKSCKDCRLHTLFFAFGKANIVCSPTGHALGGIDEKHLKESRNAGYCPLIEIPPHGRLIDADALVEKHGDWYTEEGTEEGFIGTIKNLIATIQTIIPTEEGDN